MDVKDEQIFVKESPKLKQCILCGKSMHPDSISRHMKGVHEMGKELNCDVCGKKFFVKAHLSSHLLLHSGVKPYACTPCNRAYATKELLNRHIRSRHSELKPYVCDICEKAFVTRSQLKKHLLCHKEKSHECTVCDHAYPTEDLLKRHVDSRHLGVKPFPCDICEKRFFSRSLLKLHLDCHKERSHECETCMKMFKTLRHLRQHKVVHENMKPFLCPICKKECKYKYTLNRHILLYHPDTKTSTPTEEDQPLPDKDCPPKQEDEEPTMSFEPERIFIENLSQDDIKQEDIQIHV